jgi:NAD(P)-dependent dehydrogenase (short-subunit alcohol dehydrogenase family)
MQKYKTVMVIGESEGIGRSFAKPLLAKPRFIQDGL